jgi:hypothetical protein
VEVRLQFIPTRCRVRFCHVTYTTGLTRRRLTLREIFSLWMVFLASKNVLLALFDWAPPSDWLPRQCLSPPSNI